MPRLLLRGICPAIREGGKGDALCQASGRLAAVAQRADHKATCERFRLTVKVSLKIFAARVAQPTLLCCSFSKRLPVIVKLENAEAFTANAVVSVVARAAVLLRCDQICHLKVRGAVCALRELFLCPQLAS